MRQRYYKQKRIKKLFVVHQRGNAYEKEIFENMYQCFGSNGSLAKRMRQNWRILSEKNIMKSMNMPIRSAAWLVTKGLS